MRVHRPSKLIEGGCAALRARAHRLASRLQIEMKTPVRPLWDSGCECKCSWLDTRVSSRLMPSLQNNERKSQQVTKSPRAPGTHYRDPLADGAIDQRVSMTAFEGLRGALSMGARVHGCNGAPSPPTHPPTRRRALVPVHHARTLKAPRSARERVSLHLELRCRALPHENVRTLTPSCTVPSTPAMPTRGGLGVEGWGRASTHRRWRTSTMHSSGLWVAQNRALPPFSPK